jgi:soluble lytic murein transglycosylase
MRGIFSSDQRLARIVMMGILAAVGGAGLWGTPALAAETASLPSTPKDVAVELRDVLTAADRARYRKIFSIQKRGDWRNADRLIKQLNDKLLLGHVLAQRYLHPTKYR